MKYFKAQNELTKTAGWTSMIKAEQDMTSARFVNDPALAKLSAALKTIEAKRPLAAGKNPNTDIKYLL